MNKNQLIHYGLFNVVMNISFSEFQIDVNGDLSRLKISFQVELVTRIRFEKEAVL